MSRSAGGSRSDGGGCGRARPSLALALALAILSGGPLAAAGDGLFADIAASSGLRFTHFNGMSGELYFAEMTGAGAAFLDYDGDGDLDAYLVQGTMLGRDRSPREAVFPPRHPLPLTDRLYRNDLEVAADGTRRVRFVDVTEASGLGPASYGMGVAAGDYDNDGRVDLYVTSFGSNRLLHNNGDGTFTDVTAAAGVDDPRWSVPAAWVDYDQDGWLDLFVGNYVDFRIENHKKCASATGAFDYCGPLAYRPEPDRLFHNRGDGTFEDRSVPAGIQTEYGGALGVVTSDFNGDGRPDIYVANDGTPNQLWINQGDGTFANEALLGGCAVNEEGMPEASMGVVAGDLNGDGYEDLFMAHLTRETNTLYLGSGDGFFEDSSRQSGLGSPSWTYTGFGTALFDYDNDGWLDLFVANGAVKHIEEEVRRHDPYPLHQTNQLFRNAGGGRFEEVTASAGPDLGLSEVSRGVAVGDVDNDGDSDLLVANNAGPARLLENRVGAAAPWLGVVARVRGSGRSALGTRIWLLRERGGPLLRRVATDGSYASSGDPRLLFGLATGGARELRVLWPSGVRTAWRRLPAGRYLVLAGEAGRAR